jgi:hypothetical protein
MESLQELIALLRDSDEAGRTLVREKLLVLCREKGGSDIQAQLQSIAKGEILEVQWEIEEVLEELAPPPAPVVPPEVSEEPKEEKSPPPPDGRLNTADLDMVYEDPRGLVLHRTKTGDRWFATQVDPGTGKPGTFELQPQEVDTLKSRLEGSPYWAPGLAPRVDVKMP